MFKAEGLEAKLEGLYAVIEGIEDKPYIAADCKEDFSIDKERVVAISSQAASSGFLISKDFWMQNFKIAKEMKVSREFEIAGEAVALNFIDAIGGPIVMPEDL
jgi:hypothetical protein